MRKIAVVALMTCCWVVSPSFALIGAIADPMATIQRGIMIVEAKLRTLQTVKLLQDTYNNYKTAKMMYEQAKAGYEQLSDPNTWESLKKFAEKRFSNIIDLEGDPYNSSLYRMTMQLDEAADTYLKSLANTEAMIEKIDWMDESMAEGLSRVGVGNWGGAEQWAGDLNKRSEVAAKMKEAIRASVKAWGADADKMLPFVQMAFEEKDRLDAETKTWSKAAQDAFNAKLQSESEIKKAADEIAAKAAKVKYDLAENQYSNMLKEKEVLDKKKQGWLDKWGPLVETFQSYQKKLDTVMGTLGFSSRMNDAFYNTISLSKMAQHNAILLEYVESMFFRFLVISLAIALLWAGIQVHKGEGIVVPHQVILGVLGAVIFLAPRSPLAMHNVAREIAVCTDALTLSFTGAVSNPATVVTNAVTQGVINTVRSYASTKDKGVVMSILTVGMDGIAEMLKETIVASIGVFVSLLGALSVIIILLLRNMLFWLLMVVSPMVIFMAPLPYGRKIITNWGQMLYGVILMGPISLLMLIICNGAMSAASGAFTDNAYGGGAQAYVTMLTGIFNGLIMLAAMIVSPFFALSLAQGSFDGLTKGMSTAATVIATAGAGAMVAAGGVAAGGFGRGMSAAGSGMSKMSAAMGGGGGGGIGFAPAMKNIGARALSKAGGAMQKGGNAIGKFSKDVQSSGSEFAANTIRKGLKFDKSGGVTHSGGAVPPPERQVRVEGLHTSAPSAVRPIQSSGAQDSNSEDKS